jgi:threonine aldolase
MRQAGIIAAGALFALENNIPRLAEDHTNARLLADAVRKLHGLTLEPDVIDTNIVIFRVDPRLGTAADFAAALRERGVLVLPFGPQQIRAVTHLDVSRAQIEQAAEAIVGYASRRA